MKTLVLGGGVVGVTTAYFLAKAGHEVTLVEEKDAVGLEAKDGTQLRVVTSPAENVPQGSPVWLYLPPERCRVLSG